MLRLWGRSVGSRVCGIFVRREAGEDRDGDDGNGGQGADQYAYHEDDDAGYHDEIEDYGARREEDDENVHDYVQHG